MKAMISSTAVDLPEHRKQAVDACLREGILPVAMEQLPARDATGVQASLEMVDQADIYIGIYGWRYGWVPDGSDISITEMEFDHAVERKQRGQLKDILVFVMHEDHPVRPRDVETGDVAQAKLQRFKERASAGRVRLTFKSPEELRGQIIQSLADWKRRLQATPRDPVTSGDTRDDASGPSREQSEFMQKLWADFKTRPGVGAAIKMLDAYQSRRIEFGAVGAENDARFQEVSTLEVITALAETDPDDDPKEPFYNAIRDCFDAFFDGLEEVEVNLRSGMIHHKDFQSYFGYWIQQFADTGASNKGAPFVAAARSYVVKWYPDEVQQLAARLGCGFPSGSKV
jgi:hypothetical protein